MKIIETIVIESKSEPLNFERADEFLPTGPTTDGFRKFQNQEFRESKLSGSKWKGEERRDLESSSLSLSLSI